MDVKVKLEKLDADEITTNEDVQNDTDTGQEGADPISPVQTGQQGQEEQEGDESVQKGEGSVQKGDTPVQRGHVAMSVCRCAICNKMFLAQEHLTRHMQQDHPGQGMCF